MPMPAELRILFALMSFAALFLAIRSKPWWERLGFVCLAISIAILVVQSAVPASIQRAAPVNLDRLGTTLMWLFLGTMAASAILDLSSWVRRRTTKIAA